MLSALLIYNPVAGRYPSGLLTERAANVFRQSGWRIEIAPTQSGAHLTRLAQEAATSGMDAVIVAGGDGSINQALPALIGSQTALGVLPAGTSNVWAQELGLPGLSWTRWMALEESARRLARPQVRLVDIGMANSSPFLLWAGVGLDAFIVHRIEPRSQWQKNLAVAHYAAVAVWNASMWHGLDLTVDGGDRQLRGRYMLAVVSNVRLYAGGLATISPSARLDDGRMDLWLFEGQSLEDTVQLAWQLWSGRHVQSERVQCIPFEKISLVAEAPIHMELDGEPGYSGECLNIEVAPRALRVLVPESAPQALFARPVIR